jgi:hypothetical protein
MARSQQFMDGWRCAEKRVVTWLHDRAQQMGDPRATAILNVAADDFGYWAKHQYPRGSPADIDDPSLSLASFRAAVRREALEEAARIVESLACRSEESASHVRSPQRNDIAAALRAAIDAR